MVSHFACRILPPYSSGLYVMDQVNVTINISRLGVKRVGGSTSRGIEGLGFKFVFVEYDGEEEANGGVV